MDFIVTQNGSKHSKESNILQINADRPVYEVIRVMDGRALFLEDHFDRLVSSIQTRGLLFKMEFTEFRNHIAELSNLNGIQNDH